MVCFIAINRQSLWIDEGHSASKAIQPNLSSLWSSLKQDRDADLKMPFYMIYLWTWAHLGAHSEWALRLSNIPWFLASQMIWIFGLRRYPKLALITAFIALINPFLWIYLTEARPYMMEYCLGCYLLVGLILLLDRNRRPHLKRTFFWEYSAATILLCGASLLSVPFAIVSFITFWSILFKEKRFSSFSWKLPFYIGTTIILLVGAYYIWTIDFEKNVYGVWSTGWLNLAFAGYELLGLSGLGPSKIAIREHGISAFFCYSPILIVALIPLWFLLMKGISRLTAKLSRYEIAMWIFYFLVPFLFLFFLGIRFHFRILGRHLMPLLPCFLLLVSAGIRSAWSSRRKYKIFIFLMMGIWLSSALSLRFAPRHFKDDYRSAARVAKKAQGQGKTVWWVADAQTGNYYGLTDLTIPPKNGSSILLLASPSEEALQHLAAPEMVLLSRPDAFDCRRAIQNYLAINHYRVIDSFRDFTVYGKPMEEVQVSTKKKS